MGVARPSELKTEAVPAGHRRGDATTALSLMFFKAPPNQESRTRDPLGRS
jgi:hypothetical protein